ncbi:MAG: hypothetical protein JNL62_15165 [Bryobacterales bacterium]|nr:hypothetical protein [Bryobacterales bacterium]
MHRLLLLLLTAAVASPQSLTGVVDIHAHCDPDVTPRSIDALNLVRLAKQKGFRGIVLKNHYEPTASWAALARQEVPGIEVFGGIALNRSNGGVNPAAVERMAKVKGGWGRIVWMPTFDSENHVRLTKEQRPHVSVARAGNLLPETLQVLDLIAKYKLVLATGHSAPEESLAMIREARRRGIASIVVTHPMNQYVRMNIAQMKQAVAMGAMLEFTGNAVLGLQKENEFKDYAGAMRQAGLHAVILSSDFGQNGNPLHPDGLQRIFEGLRKEGLTSADIERIVKANPAKLMGLP